MATAAFKSTSRRVAPEPKAEKQPAALRRSHSVNAGSRKTHLPFEDSNSISSEFSVRRENPLFWASSSSPPEKEEVSLRNGEIKLSSYSSNHLKERGNSGSFSEVRGRSVTRNCNVRNGIGRSLSRVRGRSVSRAQDKGVYESENEVDTAASTNARSRNKREQISDGMNKINSTRIRVDTWGSVKNSGITATWNRETECFGDDSAFSSMKISHLEDELSTGSLSEAEEKTIKTISDDFNVFRRENTNIVTATHVPDMPPDMVNPTVVGLASDVRREYSIKLQESEERARKLRTDLAIEEHRGKELNRILKEIIPDSKTSSVQKSHRGRRTSNERKWVSNRLSEEAMAYFDECVSLSTFDSSDFSAAEDPPYSSVAATIAVHSSSPLKESPCMLLCHDQCSDPHEKQVLPHHGSEDSGKAVNKSSSEPGVSTQSYQFSFTDEQSENESIRSCIKHFERGAENGIDSVVSKRTCYDADEYVMRSCSESVFIDKVLYLNQIKSGSLLLCEGCAISYLPFS